MQSTEPSIPSAALDHPDRAAFRVRGLTKVYGEEPLAVHALRGVDLDFDHGEIAALVGPSGSGKSTFLNIIGGLDRPTAGHVYFGDLDLIDLSDRDLTRFRREHVGFVFQFYNLIASLTAAENVALVTEITHDPLPPKRALGLVGLSDRADHFPSQLSGGEQQRVAVARAIAKQPDILLCDEPTGALDSATGGVVLEAIARINRELGTTTVLITHNRVIADMADRVISFADGSVASAVRNAERRQVSELNW